MKKNLVIYPFNSRLHTIYNLTLDIFSKNYNLHYNFLKKDNFYKLKNNLFLKKIYYFIIPFIKKIKKRWARLQKETKINPENNLLFCFNELPPKEFDFILDLEIVTGMSGYEYDKLDKEYISERLTSNKCKAIICWNKSSYLSLTKTIDCSKFKNKIKIIPFSGEELNIKKVTKENINFLFVSSINNPDAFETKGGLIALEAYSILSKRHNNIKFFVRANIKEDIIKKYKDTPGLIFLKSYLSDKKMKELMLNSDILFEPIPGIELLLECMSFGIPAISFNFWCIEEMILNGKSGFLIDSSKIFGSKKNMEEYVKNTNENYKKLYKVEECNKYVEEFVNKCEILIKNRKLLNKMREEQQSFVKIGGKHNMQKRSNNLINLINSV